jgi:hypothetical protein
MLINPAIPQETTGYGREVSAYHPAQATALHTPVPLFTVPLIRQWHLMPAHTFIRPVDTGTRNITVRRRITAIVMLIPKGIMMAIMTTDIVGTARVINATRAMASTGTIIETVSH